MVYKVYWFMSLFLDTVTQSTQHFGSVPNPLLYSGYFDFIQIAQINCKNKLAISFHKRAVSNFIKMALLIFRHSSATLSNIRGNGNYCSTNLITKSIPFLVRKLCQQGIYIFYKATGFLPRSKFFKAKLLFHSTKLRIFSKPINS